MPNHVYNQIKTSADAIKSLLDEEGNPDFNTVIPMHEDLDFDMINGGSEMLAREVYREDLSGNPLIASLQHYNISNINLKDFDDASFKDFMKFVENKRHHGFYHCLDFASSQWGTKWNAYSANKKPFTETKINFLTAWNHPFPVIKELSKHHPNDEIIVDYADEDHGSNCGTYTIQNGSILSKNIAPNWNDADKAERAKWVKFSFFLHYPDGNPIDHGLNEDFQYVDEDEQGHE